MQSTCDLSFIYRVIRTRIFEKCGFCFAMLAVFLTVLSGPGFAIVRSHPPFTGEEKWPDPVSFQNLPDDYRDGDWAIKTYEDGLDSLMPKVTDVYYKGRRIWASEGGETNKTGNTRTQFAGKADLNHDGVDDIVVLTGNTGNSYCTMKVTVAVFLRDKNGGYQTLEIETMTDDAGKDFVDFDNDGIFEFLRCGMVSDIESMDGKSHTYWLYTIHEIKDGQFVLNNSLREGFPRFIWFTYKPNDKPTAKISDAVKKAYVERPDFGKISYADPGEEDAN